MPTYPTYKLGDVADILDSFRKPINSTERAKRIQGKNETELYPYYGATGQVGLIDEYLTDGEYVLVGEDGAPFLEPFKPKSYIIRGKAWVNNHAHILSGKKDVSCNQYLNYYLNSFDYKDFVNGTTRLKLTQGNLVEIPIPLPSLPTQQAIVSRIESLFAELDKAVEKLKTAQQQLKIYKQALLNHCLNNEDGKWETVKLGEVIDKPIYGTSKKCDYEIAGAGTGVLRIPNIGDGYIIEDDLKFALFSEDEKKKYSLKEGDLLTIRSNGSVDLVGKCALISCNEEKYLYAGYLIRLRPNGEKANSKFLLYTLESYNLRVQIEEKAKSTSGVNNINSAEIQSLQISLPPLPDQQRIVQEIESRLSQAEAAESRIAEALQKTEALRQSILKKAFSGELV